MEEAAEKFLLQEYVGLRDELMECVKESRSLERNALLASGAVWAWAIANKTQSVYQPLLLVPPLIALLSALRAWALWKHLKQMSTYIQAVESALSLPDGLGWERRFAASTDYSKSISAGIFWTLLFSATVFAAVRFG
jgi:hypothetical protein